MKKLPIFSALFFTVLSLSAFAGRGGDTKQAAINNPILLPFSEQGSLCGANNDVDNIRSNGISTIYMSGRDWIYYFTAPESGEMNISLTNMYPIDPNSSLSVWENDIAEGKCIGSATHVSYAATGLMVNVTKGQSYFILVDNWPSPDCYDYTIGARYTQPSVVMAPCTNVDFESGNFTGWTGTQGSVTCGPVNAPTPNYVPGVAGLPSPQHTIMTGTGLDPCGGFPVVCPGGNVSVRMGNGQVSGNGAAQMQQTFTVSTTNSVFTYWYAAVVQDAYHLSNEQPFFRAEVLDQNGNPIPCGQYLVVGGPNIPGFSLSTTCGFQDVYYRPWTPVNVDLSAYIGQNITVRFTVGDCCYGGHYGYAYVDASCAPMQIMGNDTICFGSSTTLSAPAGSAQYLWSTGATTQNITVSPTTMTMYTCTLTSVINSQCQTVLQDTVWVIPSPTAAFTPTGGGACGGGTFTFTNSTTGAVSYTWNFGDGSPLDNQQSPTHTYTSPGTYTVTLIASGGGACADTVQQVVTINSNVTAQFQSTTVCLNNPTVFTDLSQGGPGNWNWNFGEPSSGPNNVSTLQNPSHTYSSPGTYTVTLIVSDPNNNCWDTTQVQVVVNPLPVAQFVATSVCIGNTTVFTDQSTISGGSITQWNWNFGDPNSGPNNISTLQNPSHTFTAAGNYSVILTVTSNNGCQSTITLPVTVYPNPVAAFTATTVCQNTPTGFNDISTGAISWAWNFGDPSSGPANTSALQNPTHSYTSAGTFTATLIVTGQGGCQDTTSVQVTVNPLPQSNFSATTVCVGLTTAFTDLSTVSSGTITQWSWNYGDGSPVGTVQNPAHQYMNAGTYTVTLTVTSSNGCTGSFQLPVTVNPLPNPGFTSTTVCVGGSTQFTDMSTIASGTITQWAWYFGDNTASALQNPSHTYTSAGTYTVSLITTSAAGCVDSISLQITVNPLPVVAFTADDTNGCVTHCVNFTDQSTVTSGTITQWFWDFGDGSTSTQQHPSHCYSVPGTYDITLTVTTSNGCSQTYTNYAYIIAYPLPTAEFNADPWVTTVVDPTIQFTDLSQSNIVSWYWTFGDGFDDSLQNPSHVYPNDNTGVHTYTVTLTVTNIYGCTDDVSHDVIINPEFTFFAPNCVTANGDGINDFFFTYGIGWKEYKLFIYDRWGNKIFWTDDMNKGWDARVMGGPSGDIVQEDTYVWKVYITDVFDKKHQYVGHVSVIK
ncbi:MAG: PKD domain-containing protein [Bacteroidota bacterium]